MRLLFSKPAQSPSFGDRIGGHASALALSRPHLRQNARWTSGFEPVRFIIYSQTEKLSGSFRVLVRNRHRLAPPRRDHVVDSTSVWFPYGQTCLNASGACYRRGGSPH